jgi:hypothetical protein
MWGVKGLTISPVASVVHRVKGACRAGGKGKEGEEGRRRERRGRGGRGQGRGGGERRGRRREEITHLQLPAL